jgi:hypothetical protein
MLALPKSFKQITKCLSKYPAKKGMAKKHSFHCQVCNSELTIYKKGKKHRVLVCPTHGIIATNPFSLKGAAGGAILGAELGSVVPILGTAAGALAGGAIGALTGRKSPKTTPEGVPARVHSHRLNALDWADRALSTR